MPMGISVAWTAVVVGLQHQLGCSSLRWSELTTSSGHGTCRFCGLYKSGVTPVGPSVFGPMCPVSDTGAFQSLRASWQPGLTSVPRQGTCQPKACPGNFIGPLGAKLPSKSSQLLPRDEGWRAELSLCFSGFSGHKTEVRATWLLFGGLCVLNC